MLPIGSGISISIDLFGQFVAASPGKIGPCRLLLTWCQLTERVERSLRPLTKWQIVQILAGIFFIALGAQCWAPNTGVPHRLVSGVITHVYGVVLIIGAANVIARIKMIDYSKPVQEVRERLNTVRNTYIRFGPLIGFPWWLLWVPAAVCLGLDVVMHPNCLIPSMVVGVIGLTVSIWLYVAALRCGNPKSDEWRREFTGGSLRAADLALSEMIDAGVA